MIITTTPSIAGKEIIEYRGIVFGEVISGINVIKDFAAGLSNFFGGMLVSATALSFYILGLCQNYETVIIGSIMPLVPGFCITTAVRDIMSGDYLSGTSRMAEATLAATAIAAGVGILLSVYFSFGGGGA